MITQLLDEYEWLEIEDYLDDVRGDGTVPFPLRNKLGIIHVMIHKTPPLGLRSEFIPVKEACQRICKDLDVYKSRMINDLIWIFSDHSNDLFKVNLRDHLEKMKIEPVFQIYKEWTLASPSARVILKAKLYDIGKQLV